MQVLESVDLHISTYLCTDLSVYILATDLSSLSIYYLSICRNYLNLHK